ncbi:MAG: oxidoreductase [Candidatus Limnocylindrales bacterium]|jgi:NAD(P)-dependent dehydrogenase (short-subunit alcohol dehydrogenase family)
MGWKASDIPDLTGKVAVVTGGNGGLGLETARQLAAHGALVVIGARNLDKAEAAREQIAAMVPAASLEIRKLDLGSLASIAEFAGSVKETHPKVDLLFNNAAVMAVREGTTADGFETQFGTNHLGHFALTMHLLPALLAAPSPRVVSTTSIYRNRAGRYDLSNPHMRGCYDPWVAYGMSKRAELQFAFELNRWLRDRGLAAFAADPGFSRTDLQPASVRANNGFQQRLWLVLARLMGQSAAMGALPQLRAGTDPAAVGGTLYAPRWIVFGAPVVRGVGRRIDDPAQMTRVWELSERETGLSLAAALDQLT